MEACQKVYKAIKGSGKRRRWENLSLTDEVGIKNMTWMLIKWGWKCSNCTPELQKGTTLQ